MDTSEKMKVASVLGALYGLKAIDEVYKAKGGPKVEASHVENSISALLASSTLSDVASYLTYQVGRQKEKTTYKNLLDLVRALEDVLELKPSDRDWKEYVLQAFINFKRVAVGVSRLGHYNPNCAKEALDLLKSGYKNAASNIDKADRLVTKALACLAASG